MSFDSLLKRIELLTLLKIAFEVLVDLGGSRFSESILERWHFARASQ